MENRGQIPHPSCPSFYLLENPCPSSPSFSGSRYDATCLDYSQASFYLLILPSQIYGFHPLSLGDILLKKTPGARSCSSYQCSFLPRRVFSSWVRVFKFLRSFWRSEHFSSSGVYSSARVFHNRRFLFLMSFCICERSSLLGERSPLVYQVENRTRKQPKLLAGAPNT